MWRCVSKSLKEVTSLIQLNNQHSHASVVRSLQNSLNTQLQAAPALSRNLHLSAFRTNQSNTEDLDRTLHRLDHEIRRTGRIARQEIMEILQDIREMKKATSSQSLMIIRCCGDLVPAETPENRTRLVQEVWKTMENLNVPIDISHYNALLRVYLENEHKFNPTEFLQELSNKGIEPNRVTYQRLIARFCQDGDIDGASTILQHMKEKQLPINEHVFNSLILGHARADDMESAEGIINVMKQAGLEPNDDTYVALMCGYAKSGDLENIKRIIKDCNEKEVFLIDRDYLNVIYSLAANGHDHVVEEIIPFLKKHTGFNQDATNLILRLVNIGKEDVGFRILKEMTKLIRNEEVLPSGNFFIHHLVTSATPSENIVKYCQLMAAEGLHPHALSKACESALEAAKFDKAFDLLEALKNSGAPLRQHYFWPFFAGSRSEKHVFDGLKCMKSLEIPPVTETLRDYIIPALLKHSNGNSYEKSLEKLSSYSGVPLSAIVPAAMHQLLNDNNLKVVAQFAAKYRLRFNSVQLRRSVVDAYIKGKDAKTFVQIIGSSGLDGEDKGRETVGFMLMELVESLRPKEKARLLLPVLTELLERGLGISNSGSELIQNGLGEELTPELTNLILQLTSGDLTPKLEFYNQQRQAGGFTLFEDKSIKELEDLLDESKVSGKPNRGLKKALLFHYCRQKNIEKAEPIKQELLADGFVFNTGLQALLLDLYASCNKLEEAKQTYATLISSIDSPIDDIKILRYAHLLLSNERVDECLEVLKDTPRDESRKPSGAVQQATAWKLLNTVADSGQVEKTKELFQVLKDRNLININNVILGPLVKVHLVKEDLDGALVEFERCVKEHHSTPFKQDLFCRLIKAEDTERLQKVMDLSTNLHGEVNSMYDLVFAFIQCGKLRQAKKILETPGLRARNDKIEYTCQKYLEENRVSELENLIQVTKDLPNLDRNSMYFYLLQSYCKAGDKEKALSVWTSLQEESIQPSTELLSFLADFLRKNNEPIPFVLPESATQTTTETSGMGSSTIILKFRENIEANQIDAALQIKQRLDGNNNREKLSIQDLTLLIEKMTRAERLGEATRLTEEMFEKGVHPLPRTLRFLLGRLASSGDVDVLTRLQNKLTPELKRQSMYNTRLSIAYTNAGRGKEYFENFVKKGVENLSKSDESVDKESMHISLAGSTYMLIRNEDLLSSFEELAATAESKGNSILYNTLWNYNLLKKNFAKAKEIFQNKLINEQRLLFRSIMIESKVKMDEELAKEVASQLASTSLASNVKGVAHSCVIDVLCSKDKADEALSYLQSNLKTLKLEDFNRSSLGVLKDKLEAAKKKCPYEIPKPKSTKGSKAADNSDSDTD